MKSLVRWSATLGLVGTTLLGSFFGGNLRALALTEQQVMEKLRTVPVFMIMNPQGEALMRTVTEGQNRIAVTDVYMDGQDAQQVITELQNLNASNPEQAQLAELAQTLQVRALPLALIYQDIKENANQQNDPRFAFTPDQQDWNAAAELLRQSGQQAEQIRSIPLFVVRFGPDQGYVFVQRGAGENQKPMIPVFFDYDAAQNVLNQVKQQNPQADIQVVDIEQIINTLINGDNEQLELIELIPSIEAIEYMQTLQ